MVQALASDSFRIMSINVSSSTVLTFISGYQVCSESKWFSANAVLSSTESYLIWMQCLLRICTIQHWFLTLSLCCSDFSGFFSFLFWETMSISSFLVKYWFIVISVIGTGCMISLMTTFGVFEIIILICCLLFLWHLIQCHALHSYLKIKPPFIRENEPNSEECLLSWLNPINYVNPSDLTTFLDKLQIIIY